MHLLHTVMEAPSVSVLHVHNGPSEHCWCSDDVIIVEDEEEEEEAGMEEDECG